MTPTDEKVRENRLRRMAERQGLALRKSRRRDRRAFDYGVWWLVSAETEEVKFGGRDGVTLDEIERVLDTADLRRAFGREPRYSLPDPFTTGRGRTR